MSVANTTYEERQTERRRELKQHLARLQNVKLRGCLTRSTEEQVDASIQVARSCIAFLDAELQ